MAFFTPWKLSSQKLGFFLVTFGFIWGMMLLHFTIQQRTQPESSSMLREQILDLSKRYIKALAEENRNVVDGPYAGVMTAYDFSIMMMMVMMVIMMVLVVMVMIMIDGDGDGDDDGDDVDDDDGGDGDDNDDDGDDDDGDDDGDGGDVDDGDGGDGDVSEISYRRREKTSSEGRCCNKLGRPLATRIGKLESKVDNLVNGTGANSTNSTTAVPSLVSLEKINVADIINGVQEKCVLPPMDGYPHCEGKIKWMKDMWRSDPCYADYGVDGTPCSFFIYLSEYNDSSILWTLKRSVTQLEPAEIRTDFNILYGMMKKHEEFRWMRLRIRRMADAWIQAIKSLAEKQNLEKRKRKKILVHLGLLTKESGFKIAETAFSAHTPDNSFLGFVVEQHLNSSDIHHINEIKRQNQSLVYGKVDNFWKNKKIYLDIIHTYMEVHATVYGSSTKNIPSYVKNHGILSGRDLQFLLRETK
ncbi:hypothetical protein A6R68_13353, partial [Neotoma lepida]